MLFILVWKCYLLLFLHETDIMLLYKHILVWKCYLLLFPQETDIMLYKDRSPLGLKLQKTPSLINSIEMKLLEARKRDAKLDHEKLKASNFPARLLQIGSWVVCMKIFAWLLKTFIVFLIFFFMVWSAYLDIKFSQRPCRNEGDLVAKCYYAKKKIVWEILEGALKRKIEVQWSDIIGIKAIVGEDRPGILELEVQSVFA